MNKLRLYWYSLGFKSWFKNLYHIKACSLRYGYWEEEKRQGLRLETPMDYQRRIDADIKAGRQSYFCYNYHE